MIHKYLFLSIFFLNLYFSHDFYSYFFSLGAFFGGHPHISFFFVDTSKLSISVIVVFLSISGEITFSSFQLFFKLVVDMKNYT